MTKKICKTLAILMLGLAVCATADPIRRRPGQQRGFARQEIAAPPSPAPTGYPEAGVTPSVPFELPPSSAATPPDNTYGPPPQLEAQPESQPDNVYGPPEDVEIPADAPIETDDIPQEPELEGEPLPETETRNQDEPEAEEEDGGVLVTVAEDGSVIAVANASDQPANPARLYQRFPQSRRRQGPVPERLVLAKPQNFIYMFRQQSF